MVAFLIFSPVQLLSHVRFFATPWTAARQASLSITNSWSLLKLMWFLNRGKPEKIEIVEANSLDNQNILSWFSLGETHGP